MIGAEQYFHLHFQAVQDSSTILEISRIFKLSSLRSRSTSTLIFSCFPDSLMIVIKSRTTLDPWYGGHGSPACYHAVRSPPRAVQVPDSGSRFIGGTGVALTGAQVGKSHQSEPPKEGRLDFCRPATTFSYLRPQTIKEVCLHRSCTIEDDLFLSSPVHYESVMRISQYQGRGDERIYLFFGQVQPVRIG